MRQRDDKSRLRRLIGSAMGLRKGYRPVFRAMSNAWLTCVVFPTNSDRDRVLKALDAVEIESRPLWKPMHLQPVFADCPSVVDGTSEDLFSRGLCVPSSSALSDEEVAEVISVIAEELR
jgi:dTDP-4-amino-4,6-dideoxygalactose transaminase